MDESLKGSRFNIDFTPGIKSLVLFSGGTSFRVTYGRPTEKR